MNSDKTNYDFVVCGVILVRLLGYTMLVTLCGYGAIYENSIFGLFMCCLGVICLVLLPASIYTSNIKDLGDLIGKPSFHLVEFFATALCLSIYLAVNYLIAGDTINLVGSMAVFGTTIAISYTVSQ